jgi:hydrogenase nickel incorporation protein HypB
MVVGGVRISPAAAEPFPYGADLAVVTKIDLAAAVEFNREIAYNNIQAVRPGMKVFPVSAKSADGIHAFLEFLAARLAELRQAAIV